MPSEPAESNFKTKVHATAYPTHERNGIIWAYMGPREVPPPLPDIEANMLDDGAAQISILHATVQLDAGLEGEMDTVHAAFLHCGADAARGPRSRARFDYYQCTQRARQVQRRSTPSSARPTAPTARPRTTRYYWRIAHMLFPFYAMIPTGALGRRRKLPRLRADGRRPHAAVGDLLPRRTAPAPQPRRRAAAQAARAAGAAAAAATCAAEQAPAGTTASTSTRTWTNDYLIDREAQRNGQSYTGIPGIRQQDMAVTESMGPIYDRSTSTWARPTR